jgi:hypothetical protein
MFTFSHTTYIEKQIIEPTIASSTTNILARASYKSVGPQNDPTFLEYVVLSLHIILGEVVPRFVYVSIVVGGITFSLETFSPMHDPITPFRCLCKWYFTYLQIYDNKCILVYV